ncbi:MAG: hypothetical protein ACI4RS_04220 [Monoglobaceae bacterium]
MKKLLFCMVLSIMMLSVLPAYAETTTYTPDENGGWVSSDVAKGKRTVLIKNDETDTIVYVNQAETAFTAATQFLIKKETPADGMYTILLGGDDGQNVTSTFYIGMNYDSGDIKMVKRINPEDQIENGVRYACSVSGAKEFKTVIIKMGGEYYGFNAPNGWSVSGTSTSFGVEIKSDNDDDVNQITDVWLSERVLNKDTNTLTKGTPAQGGQTE